MALLAVVALGIALRRSYRTTQSRWAKALTLAGLVALAGTVVQAMGNFSLPVMSNLIYVALVVALAFQAARERP